LEKYSKQRKKSMGIGTIKMENCGFCPLGCFVSANQGSHRVVGAGDFDTISKAIKL
jgi:hypothetical protein